MKLPMGIKFHAFVPGVRTALRHCNTFFILAGLLPGLLLADPIPEAVEDSSDWVSANSFEEEDSDSEASKEEPEELSLIDRQKRNIDAAVQQGSQAVDAFFGDINYEEEYAYTQLRVRPEVYYSDKGGTEFNLKVLAKIRLPNLGDRVSFVAGSDPDGDDFNDSIEDASEDAFAGLQFFLKSSESWNASISAGFKFNSFAGYVGPRVRYTRALSEIFSVRATQTLRWQTNNYWDIGSRLDLNFLLSDSLFFRQTVFGRWRGEKSDERGYQTNVASVLSQRLSDTAGLQYEFETVFYTEPDTHVDEYVLALRYRKRTARDWLYFEIVPQVAFEDEYDYKANLGIRFRLEFFFGAEKSSGFWKHSNEDTDEFRW